MRLYDLQAHLKATGRYSGELDGKWGRLTEAGVLLLLTDGPDTKITDDDLRAMAARNTLTFAQAKAVLEVEANGAGFEAGRPLILPEPHKFSKATGHKYDVSHPTISYRKWGQRRYPRAQDARYDQLLEMIRLNVDAGFASASYGKPQIMGFNHLLAGYDTPMAFAEAMARDEATQIKAFERFLKNTGLMAKLRGCTTDPVTCRLFCAGYNGTAYRENGYDVKLAKAIGKYS